jgi:DNA-binding CsgD family transcriptional regulator
VRGDIALGNYITNRFEVIEHKTMTIELYSSLMNVSTETALLKELVSFSENIGFNQACAFMTMRKAGASRLEVKAVDNYQETWKKSSRLASSVAVDPIVKHTSISNLPLVWGRTFFEKADAGDLWDLVKPHGFDSGIAISLRDHLGNSYKIGLSRDQPLTTDPRELSRLVADTQLFGAFAQSAMMRIWNPKPDADFPSLTAREIECLSWTLEGKTAWELGAILGITERTANFHLGNAIQKLDCDNKHSAVIKAMRMGMIR